jgi:serpin B
MARAGAVGPTATEIDKVLHVSDWNAMATGLGSLDQILATRNGTITNPDGSSQQTSLNIADQAFGQQGLALQQPYLDTLARAFGAGLRTVDYQGAPETARGDINRWVADATKDRIKELLGQGTVTPDTRLVLVNAIYLKAPWAFPFDPGRTKDGSFTTADGKAVTVPMMSAAVPDGPAQFLPYAAGDGWQAVDLPYSTPVGGTSPGIGPLVMTLILPSDMAAFEKSLTPDKLETIFASLEPSRVQVTMPKFGIDTQASLGDVLKGLGMPTAFDPSAADFSGITTQQRLFISAVIHQATIDVDEKGTEAAAATAVAMATAGLTSQPALIQMRVDHPFLFALRDTETGAILFLGRVADPSTR